MNDNELEDFLWQNGYLDLRKIPGRGWCGIAPMLYHFGLFYGMDEYGRSGHYCYPSYLEAQAALDDWDGVGDPSGNWDLHKGKIGRYKNPNLNN